MLEVWSWPTPNGHKVHIALEELGLPYKVTPVNIGAGDQFKPEFLKITRNHRIPAIVDPDGPGGRPFTLFESAAILIYLSEKTGGKLIPKDPIGRYKCLEWMMFQMGGVGPMFGQWNHFGAYAKEKIPYAIERYTNEVKRLTRVLNHRLEEEHWLAGGEYSMADIITFPWIRTATETGARFAERIVRFANLVGRQRVIGSTDCGLGGRIHPQIAWAKLEALAQGAALATRQLWR